jgi:hypothetical protein
MARATSTRSASVLRTSVVSGILAQRWTEELVRSHLDLSVYCAGGAILTLERCEDKGQGKYGNEKEYQKHPTIHDNNHPVKKKE